jgi:hypothetical protein
MEMRTLSAFPKKKNIECYNEIRPSLMCDDEVQ